MNWQEYRDQHYNLRRAQIQWFRWGEGWDELMSVRLPGVQNLPVEYPPKPSPIWICTPPDLPESPTWKSYHLRYQKVFEVGGIKFRRKSGRRVNGRATFHGRLDWFATFQADKKHREERKDAELQHRLRKDRIVAEATQQAIEDSGLEGWRIGDVFLFMGFCGKLYAITSKAFLFLDGNLEPGNNKFQYTPRQSWDRRLSELYRYQIPQTLQDEIDSAPELPDPWVQTSKGWQCRNFYLYPNGEGWSAKKFLPDGSYVVMDSKYPDGSWVSIQQAAQEVLNLKESPVFPKKVQLGQTSEERISDLRKESLSPSGGIYVKRLGWEVFYGEETLRRRRALADILQESWETQQHLQNRLNGLLESL